MSSAYSAAVYADAPLCYLRLNEVAGSTFTDVIGGKTFTISGGVSLGQPGTIDDGDWAATFDGVTGYASRADDGDLEWDYGDFFTIECSFKTTATTLQEVITKQGAAGVAYPYRLTIDATGAVCFLVYDGAGGHNPVIASASGKNDGQRHHVIFGRNTSDQLFLYVDGVASTPVADTTTTTTTNSSAINLGRREATGGYFNGTLDEIVFYDSVLSTARVAAHYAARSGTGTTCAVHVQLELSAGVWTDVTPDVEALEHLHIRYGIPGNGPLDRVAQTGTCEFTLRNDAANSGGPQGYYSPNHGNCRSGFRFGIRVRVYAIDDWLTSYKFLGVLTSILPAAGQYREQRTRCVAVDWFDEAARCELRDIAPQENKTADQLITAVLAAMPATSQPNTTDLDVCTDVFPYTFDTLGGGPVRVLSVLQDIVISEFGYLTMAGGTLSLQARTARSAATPKARFDNTMRALVSGSTLDQCFNRIEVTNHPRTVDAAAVVLFAQTGPPPAIGPYAALTFSADYRDPTNTDRTIGGKDFVTPVATTDYTANDAADGSGTPRTSTLTVVATGFAASVKFVITNGHSGTVYLTKCQYRGKGIYDLTPVTYQSTLDQDYGERSLPIDLPYQDDPAVGMAVADYVCAQYAWPAHHVQSITFLANRSAPLMSAALTLEPGDRITLTEAMTGLTLHDAFVQSVDLDIGPGPWIVCTFVLAPALAGQFWILGDAVDGVLDTTTRLGYM